MRRWSLPALVIVTALLPPLVATAEAQLQPTVALTTMAGEPKSAWTAGVLEGLLPTLGYGYAGSWTDGIVPGVVRMGGAVAMLWGVTETLSREPGDPDAGSGCTRKCTWGAVAMTVGWVWGVVGASKTARERPEHPATALARLAPRGRLSLGFRVGF